MSFQTPSVVPPGWYPDPAGSRQWRVWTGTQWSEVTRPYGEGDEPTHLVANMELARTMQRVLRAGIVGVVGGLGLLVGALAHWSGTAHPAPRWFLLSALDVAVALLVVGSVVCAFGVKELKGRWSPEAFLPGVNLFVASALVAKRLGRNQSWRVLSEVVLLVLFVMSLHANIWLAVGPMIVAYIETSWFGALVDQLSGPSIDKVVAP
ncbi:MAG TPA: DUF2510 domain-containing protein [Acidimicrobiales bacterium]